MVDRVLSLPEGTKIQVLAPVVRGRKGEHQQEFDAARRSGFVRVRADGIPYDLSEPIKLEKNKKHNIEIVVDRLVVAPSIRSRLAGSLEAAFALTGSLALVDVVDGEEILLSQSFACPEHDFSIDELAPRMFSFNNPFGACETCTGLGTFMKVDPDLVVPNKNLSIRQSTIRASGWYYAEGGIAQMYFGDSPSGTAFRLMYRFATCRSARRIFFFTATTGRPSRCAASRPASRARTAQASRASSTTLSGVFAKPAASGLRKKCRRMSSVVCPTATASG
jgi:excinuclease UvrABC ATPase subunit